MKVPGCYMASEIADIKAMSQQPLVQELQTEAKEAS